MDLYARYLRPLAFRMDAERAHDAALAMVERGLFRAAFPVDRRLVRRVAGIEFANPLGLAAGLDKNARAVHRWHDLGFGHVEIGTVTPRPQPGNPAPRLFRLPEDEALINRMGFNNDGARTVAERLGRLRPDIPIGLNVGKNKDTPLDRAPEDYADALRELAPHGAYAVVNVSSPNTPGLRSLQERGPLEEILAAAREAAPALPLFVKVSPDLTDAALDELLDVALARDLAGVVATNTTLGREGLRSPRRSETGGLSGAPLRARADEVLARVRRALPAPLAVIAVGGVTDERSFLRKLELGADLVQVYTGFVYGGPGFAARLLRAALAG